MASIVPLGAKWLGGRGIKACHVGPLSHSFMGYNIEDIHYVLQKRKQGKIKKTTCKSSKTDKQATELMESRNG